ncbi:MAG: hypothetical protein QXW97_00605 [Candidatus Pacearchaeota archaeon]
MHKKTIVFAEDYSYVMTYKIALLLKKKGYNLVLIRLLEQSKEETDFFNKAYNQVIDIGMRHFKFDKKNFVKILFSQFVKSKNYFSAFIKILRLKPDLFIGRAKPNWHIAFLKKLFFKKIPFIYFPHDIRNQLIPEYVKKTTPHFEIKAEKYCFENSDGIIHKGDPRELNPEFVNKRSLGDNVKLPKFKINFLPYCLKDFIVPLNKEKLSKKDGKIHLVYTGGVKKISQDFFDNEVLKNFGEIVKQGFHIHLYFNPEKRKLQDLEKEKFFIKKFIEKNKDFPNIKNFHFHNSMNPKEIVKEISKYDFGMFAPYTMKDKNNLETIFCTGNKMSTYMEAGIPFFYPLEARFIHKIISYYKVGFPYPKNLKDLKKIIKKINYKKIEKNILKARMDFLMDKHIDRLENFINQVIESKKNKNYVHN